MKDNQVETLGINLEELFDASQALLLDLIGIVNTISEEEMKSLMTAKNFPDNHNFLWFYCENSKIRISYFTSFLPNSYHISTKNLDKINQLLAGYGFARIENFCLQMDEPSTFKIFLGDLLFNYETVSKIMNDVKRINQYFKTQVITINNTPITLEFS